MRESDCKTSAFCEQSFTSATVSCILTIKLKTGFALGVGDFISVGNLVRKDYRSCKNPPKSFRNTSMEDLSLRAVLMEVVETLFKRPLPNHNREGLKIVGHSYEQSFEDLP